MAKILEALLSILSILLTNATISMSLSPGSPPVPRPTGPGYRRVSECKPQFHGDRTDASRSSAYHTSLCSSDTPSASPLVSRLPLTTARLRISRLAPVLLLLAALTTSPAFADEYGVEVEAPTLFTGEQVMVRWTMVGSKFILVARQNSVVVVAGSRLGLAQFFLLCLWGVCACQ
jgi:hypothetical protein